MRRSLACVAISVALLTGCGREAPPQTSAPAPVVPTPAASACDVVLPPRALARTTGLALTPSAAGSQGSTSCFVQYNLKADDPADDPMVASVRIGTESWRRWQQDLVQAPGRGFMRIEEQVALGDEAMLAVAWPPDLAARTSEQARIDAALTELAAERGSALNLGDIIEATQHLTTPNAHLVNARQGILHVQLRFHADRVSPEQVAEMLPAIREGLAAVDATPR